MAPQSYPLAISQVRIERALLASISPERRKLIILLGHMTNELHVFNKALMATLDGLGDSYSKIEDFVQAGQSFVLIRDIVGKLHEARCAFQICAMAKPEIKQELDAKLSKKVLKQIRRLNRIHNDGVLAKIRNGFSYHYRDDDDYVLNAFDALSEDEQILAFMSSEAGNSFYHYSELIVQIAILRQAFPPFADESYKLWLSRSSKFILKLILDSLTQTLSLFNEVMAVVMEPVLHGADIEVVHVSALERTDVRLPFFVISSSDIRSN